MGCLVGNWPFELSFVTFLWGFLLLVFGSLVQNIKGVENGIVVPAAARGGGEGISWHLMF